MERQTTTETKTMKDEMMQAASVLLQSYYIGINARELEKALDAHYASGKGTHPTEVLSPKQYAQKNGISRDTVMRLIHAGKIEYKRIGRQYRISSSAEATNDH